MEELYKNYWKKSEYVWLADYLAATERSVTQIGQDVGFGSISTFQRSFQEIYESDAERIPVGISIVCKK